MEAAAFNDQFTETELKVLAFVTEKHGQQKRKYTHEPYVNHLVRVALKIKEYSPDSRMVMAALCHDVLEDTECTVAELYQFLTGMGLSNTDSDYICFLVKELTDVFTSEAFPQFNRKARKELEAARLWEISPEAQTIKYCDLIDNTTSIVQHGGGFAKVYLKEKKRILTNMDKGNPELYQIVSAIVETV
ncbi:HD domain-containing protein [Adhaeribacter radiodurans]|uniref:HD domain-containing protein n=1 Tax=Adhaeribacter radiodurans TaxID=2745197 RepID=A0A7L7LBB8_9BACT|nr:HD domain-containing protein [Adhaeribacter radiodurans]QMU29699.1 HD domain-containing protein [Adhaeribacter radiodurans]